jgi:hypothetical protein
MQIDLRVIAEILRPIIEALHGAVCGWVDDLFRRSPHLDQAHESVRRRPIGAIDTIEPPICALPQARRSLLPPPRFD